MEPLLWEAFLVLNITPGVIVDSGANDGRTTVMLAQQFPAHTIWSIEPIEVNVNYIHARVREENCSNVRIIHGGLGNGLNFSSYPSALNIPRIRKKKELGPQTGRIDNYRDQRYQEEQTLYPVYTIDQLMPHQRLALAHIDVEGYEIDVLEGAKRTLQRDRPPISVETFPKTNPTRHRQLMSVLSDINYDCKTIRELCGYPYDCRNMLCTPKRKS